MILGWITMCETGSHWADDSLVRRASKSSEIVRCLSLPKQTVFYTLYFSYIVWGYSIYEANIYHMSASSLLMRISQAVLQWYNLYKTVVYKYRFFFLRLLHNVLYKTVNGDVFVSWSSELKLRKWGFIWSITKQTILKSCIGNVEIPHKIQDY